MSRRPLLCFSLCIARNSYYTLRKYLRLKPSFKDIFHMAANVNRYANKLSEDAWDPEFFSWYFDTEREISNRDIMGSYRYLNYKGCGISKLPSKIPYVMHFKTLKQR